MSCVKHLVFAACVFALSSLVNASGDLLQAMDAEMGQSNIFRVYYPSEDLARKAQITFHNAVHEANHKEGYLVMELAPEEKMQLQLFGFTLAPADDFILRRNQRLEASRASLNDPNTSAFTIPGYPCYETVEETFEAAEQIVAANPELAEWIDIGDSWQKTQGNGGYDLRVLKLTNQNISGDKPALFINSAIHAREYTTAPLNLAFARWLVDGYGVDADATWMLDFQEIHLLLQANPDGRKRAETGLSWRKNVNTNFCGPTSNSRGVDLNRNFTASWNITNGQGSSGNQCSATYRGPSPGSEPETQAIENYVRTLFPDQRGPGRSDAAPDDTAGIHLDIHSFSELVLWPWGDTNQPAPNGAALQTLGRRFAFFNGYRPTQSIGLYPTDGTSDSVSYVELGVAAYTFELGTQFFQSCSVFENTIKPDNLPALIYAARVVRAPYLLPSGPDISRLNLSADTVPAGSSVTITGEATDTRFSSRNGTEATQTITAVEYFFDRAPWQSGGNPVALSASDGVFNERTEGFTGSFDTTGLADGRYTLYLRAQDQSGAWGPVSASFLTIADVPPPPPPAECETGAIPLNATQNYSGNNTGTASPGADGCSLELAGNIWQITNEAFEINPSTTVSFDFTASGDAEIQGIGFDQDTGASADRVFQLAGTQDWGISDFQYAGNGEVQRITIPVGNYFSGSGFRFVIANDKDSGVANNTVSVRNVVISTDTPPPPPEPECLVLEDVGPFTSTNTGSFNANGCRIEMSGNIWRATNARYSITPSSVLSFDFSANSTGEIHGIGFDEDDGASSNRIFKLTGSQNWGIDDFQYTGGVQRIEIPVGQYYTGNNMRLILVNDKDQGAQDNTTAIDNVILRN